MTSDRDDRDALPEPTTSSGSSVELPESSAVTTRVEQIPPGVLPRSGMGSGLLAKQATPPPEAPVAVAKVCPQCGNEYDTVDRFCPRDGSPLRPKLGNDPLVGRVIADRYLIITKLGEGGMGRVYLAEHVKMNRQCAIKVMNPSLVNDPESSARFAREASNAARIIHPNVAAVFDFGESEKIVYLVMEYVDGESLSAALARDGVFEPRRATDIARQIADGLAAAHELGIVHRDLKPDNVILARRTGREVPKVVDFGIAKAASEAPQDALTKSGLVIGTPEYMSPEQLLGDPVDERTDVYALGCILYQMLTGASPFAADSREQMIRRRLHEPPPHIRDFDANLPRRLDTLIAHMLARSPSERLGTAAAVRDALDPGLVLAGWTADSAERSAERRRLTTRNAPTVVGPPADPTLQPTIPLSVARRRSLLRVFGGSLVGSAAILLLLLWSHKANTSPAVVRTAAGVTDSIERAAIAAADSTRFANAKRVDSLARDSVARDSAKAALKRTTTSAVKSRVIPAAAGTAVAQQPGAKPTGAQHSNATDSSPEQAPTPVMRADERAAHQVLEEFANTVKSGHIEALQAKFPGMSTPVRDYFAQLMASNTNIRAQPHVGDVAIVSSDSAVVPYTIDLTYYPKGSGSLTTSKVSYSASLVKRGGHWQLAGLETRRQD